MLQEAPEPSGASFETQPSAAPQDEGSNVKTSVEENAMTDAQMGLVVATPAIIVMALLLYRMGVLQKGGVAAAVMMSLAIAVLLFLEQ